ncbi:MAG: hypothetical protein ACJ8LN_16065, partial [Sulfurifustis sp.]
MAKAVDTFARRREPIIDSSSVEPAASRGILNGLVRRFRAWRAGADTFQAAAPKRLLARLQDLFIRSAAGSARASV